MLESPAVATTAVGASGTLAAGVTLFEAADYFGGHAHTVDIDLPLSSTDPTRVRHGVDTGFLVYNDRTYPELIKLFATLGVVTAASDMSFSVQAPRDASGARLEWSGNNLSTVFAQRRNLLAAAVSAPSNGPRPAGRNS